MGVSGRKIILEQRTCATCGESQNLVQIGVPPLAFKRQELCRCGREKREDREIEQRAKALEQMRMWVEDASSVPQRYAEASLESVPSNLPHALRTQVMPALRSFVVALPDLRAENHGREVVRQRITAPGIAVIGDYGTGKTYALAAMLNAAREKLIAGALVSVTALLAEVRASYGSDRSETEARILDRYRRIPLLVIDDIDKLYATDWSTSILFHLINLRHNERRPVFITSNYDANRLLTKTFSDDAGSIGRAIIERLVEMNRWIEVRGQSLRRPQGNGA